MKKINTNHLQTLLHKILSSIPLNWNHNHMFVMIKYTSQLESQSHVCDDQVYLSTGITITFVMICIDCIAICKLDDQSHGSWAARDH